jgi:hypothetical protein
MMTNAPVKDSIYGLAGSLIPAIALITSYQEQVEYSLRITSLVVGITASLLYCWRTLRKKK